MKADQNGHRRKMPDGTGDLTDLPKRRDDAVLGDEAAEEEYCNARSREWPRSSVFGRQKRAVTSPPGVAQS